MSTGDFLQLRHRRSKALRARLHMIAQGRATYHDFHQAAVLFSELADSAWWIGAADWREQSKRLLVKSRELFDLALMHCPPNDVLSKLRILTDEAMWYARSGRHAATQSNEGAETKLGNVIDALHQLTKGGQKANCGAWHQLCIAYGWRTQLCWGEALNYAPANETNMYYWGRLTYKSYAKEAETTPDGERAYRSFLIAHALGFDSLNNKRPVRRMFAWEAARSANQHRDVPHAVRALAVMAAGRRAESHLRSRWDGQAVRTMW